MAKLLDSKLQNTIFFGCRPVRAGLANLVIDNKPLSPTMPKAHRGGSTGLLRSHSRTSSSTKIGANLQFTQKEQLPSKVIDKPKKNGYNHDVRYRLSSCSAIPDASER